MFLFHTENLPHYGLDRVFDLASKAGFDGIELTVSSCFDTQTVAYIKELEKRYKIKVKAFSLAQGQEEALFKAFQYTAREFSKSHLNLAPPKAFGSRYKQWMEEIVPRMAHKYNLVPCRKNVISSNRIGIIPSRQNSSLSELRDAGNVCLDISAMAVSNQEILRSIPYFEDSLKHIYLSNFYKEQPYSMPDQGILPLETFLSKLAENKFKGWITLKVDPVQIGEGDDEKVLDNMKRAIKFYKTYFEKVKNKK